MEDFLGITKYTFVLLLLRQKRQDEHVRDSFPTDYPNSAFAKDNLILLKHSIDFLAIVLGMSFLWSRSVSNGILNSQIRN